MTDMCHAQVHGITEPILLQVCEGHMGHLQSSNLERPWPCFACLHLMQCGGLICVFAGLSTVVIAFLLQVSGCTTGGECGEMPSSLQLISLMAVSKLESLLLNLISSRHSSSSDSSSLLSSWTSSASSTPPSKVAFTTKTS